MERLREAFKATQYVSAVKGCNDQALLTLDNNSFLIKKISRCDFQVEQYCTNDSHRSPEDSLFDEYMVLKVKVFLTAEPSAFPNFESSLAGETTFKADHKVCKLVSQSTSPLQKIEDEPSKQVNSPPQRESFTAREDKARNIIKKYAEIYLKNKQQAKLDKKTECGRFYTMIHPRKKDHNQQLHQYFFDVNGKLPVLRKPTQKLIDSETKSGKEKTAIAMDAAFIELKANTKKGFKGRVKELDEISSALAPYKTCCTSRVIDEDTIVSVQKGIDLFKLREKGPIKLNTFKKALFDLAFMHENKIFLRDIKSQNLTLDKNGNVCFIDIDEAAIPELNNYAIKDIAKCPLTPGYTTLDLTVDRTKGESFTLESIDNYAMLVAMIELTTKNEVLLGLTNVQSTPRKTIITSENKAAIEEWFSKMINPKAQTYLLEFLSDPVGCPLGSPLFELIAW